jgi:hypothetical protein
MLTTRSIPQALLLAGVLIAGPSCQENQPPPRVAEAASPAPPPARAAGEPIEVVEVVPGQLKVRVFSHVITSQAGPVPSWTYMSDGLLATGHKEISLTVKREPGEDERAFPREPLELYKGIHAYALRKQFVREGGSTRLAPGKPGLLRDDFHGILYTPGQRFDGVPAPGAFLTAILVTGPELEVADRYGHLRLMALLGDRYRFYPTTPWADRHRSPIVTPESMASSILSRVPVTHVQGASARLEAAPGAPPGSVDPSATIVLRVRTESAKGLLAAADRVGPKAGFGALLDLDPEADACLVWSPGQSGAHAISVPDAKGARISGNMLVIAPGADQDGGRPAEDGFGILLTDASWARLREALAGHKPLDIRGKGDLMSIRLSWVEETYTNPLDGHQYGTEGFRTYYPQGGAAPKKTGPVQATGIRFLTPEDQLEGRVEAPALIEYVKKLDALLEAELGSGTGPGYDVMVQIDLTPPHAIKTTLGARPQERAPASMGVVAGKVQALPGPAVKGPVSLQVSYKVRGGTGEALP